MDKLEKIEFIKSIADSITNEIIDKIQDNSIPKNWDGIELRWILKDKFSQVVWKNTGSLKRKREYNNTVLVNNII
jgi:hypothetical protein